MPTKNGEKDFRDKGIGTMCTYYKIVDQHLVPAQTDGPKCTGNTSMYENVCPHYFNGVGMCRWDGE
jgi:hypothetical protein